MIDFYDKGTNALARIIAQAGHSFHFEDGVPVTSNDAAVQAIIDSYTLEQAIDAKCADVSLHAKALRDSIIADISPGEMASWPIKLAEAGRYAGNDADVPMLAAEAAARGITVAELVAKVGNNATRFAALEAQIGGVDGKHRDAIKTLTTFKAVNQYDYSAGWPQG